MVQEILVNLPVKSLLRFFSVSKTWKSTISEPRFVKRYRDGAALPGRERIVFKLRNSSTIYYHEDDPTCLISSIPSGLTETESAVCPFSEQAEIIAWFAELWLTIDKISGSLFLWNPSMRDYKKLPDPSSTSFTHGYTYGLGYDSVGDDYKILKIPHQTYCRTELYSLRSDSWREIPSPSRELFAGSVSGGSAPVSGNLHYMSVDSLISLDELTVEYTIIAFDLSTEKFGEVEQPNFSPPPNLAGPYYSLIADEVGLTVLRGMLCATVNYKTNERKCCVWVMEEYGVAGSWSKKFTIAYSPLNFSYLEPLHFYQNGEILFRCKGLLNGLCLYTAEKTGLEPLKHIGRNDSVYDGIVYSDGVMAPTMWS